MSAPETPPPLPPQQPPPPPAPSSGQWSHAADVQQTGKGSKTWLWVALAGGGCLLLVVVAGLAATLFVPAVLRKFQKVQHARVERDLLDLREALDVYATTHANQCPDSLDALVRPDEHGHTILRDLRELPHDPWGHAYVYEAPRAGHPRPVLGSLGRDGKRGGDGEDADIFDDGEPAAGR